MTKLCIFDLDGTLINSLYDLADAMNYALKKNGFETHDREKYRYMVGNGISVLADRAMVVPEGTDSDIKNRILADFSEYYNEHNTDLTVPYDGIPEMLDELEKRNIRFCVLSNKPDIFTKQIVNDLFPGKQFVEVMGKPDPTSVFAILKELDVKAEDCLYIGDSNIDMQTAANAGITSIGVSWGFRPVSELKESGAAFIANKPQDIVEIAC